MFEFHGWINVIENSELHISEILLKEIQVKIKELSKYSNSMIKMENFNGQTHLVCSGFSNQRYNDIIKFYKWFSVKKTNSYGVLTIIDDEIKGKEGFYTITSLRLFRNELIEFIDPLFSSLTGEMKI